MQRGLVPERVWTAHDPQNQLLFNSDNKHLLRLWMCALLSFDKQVYLDKKL
ncbi:hypothetical protein [Pseudomonas violetae]|uniref:Uncharacterized protein n=1 Tax=Pseudomonas violetae TaxID=2915813 RepID=A0ABT0F8L1_9PSED|nr:hypothetical protein [Pseudomonas violetae]MCK1794325.1 hypothetical protein [Pseudomonas violetae]